MADPEALGALLAEGAVVAFTGAGISTESGIPDFRSPGGLWTRHDPRRFTFSKYVGSREVRVGSWALRRELWGDPPQPNAGHRALARLEAAGLLLGVVTQNIDGLHQAAGSARVIELHGTSREVLCIGTAPRAGTPAGCGFRAPMGWALAEVDAGADDPPCPECGGIVKSAAVSFGQNLFPGVLDQARALLASARTVLAVGSTLTVQPAAGLPVAACRAGARLAIVNDEPTPLDPLAALVLRGRAGALLDAAAAAALG